MSKCINLFENEMLRKFIMFFSSDGFHGELSISGQTAAADGTVFSKIKQSEKEVDPITVLLLYSSDYKSHFFHCFFFFIS